MGAAAWLVTGQALAGVLVQAVVAAAVALRLGRMGIVLGLFAASVSGGVISLAALGRSVADHGYGDLLQTVSRFLAASALLTIPAAAGVIGLAALGRRTVARPGWTFLRATATVGASMLALVAVQVVANATDPSASSIAPPTSTGTVVYEEAFSGPRAVHASMPAGKAGDEFVPGTGEYTHVRIDMAIGVIRGDGLVGVGCLSSGIGRYYQFWIGRRGVAIITRTLATVLTRGLVPRWDPSRPHRLTAICTDSPGAADLEFLIDGGGVLRASDTRRAGPFRPTYLMAAGVTATDADILQLRVTTPPAPA